MRRKRTLPKEKSALSATEKNAHAATALINKILSVRELKVPGPVYYAVPYRVSAHTPTVLLV
jgi:hypothetical protein